AQAEHALDMERAERNFNYRVRAPVAEQQQALATESREVKPETVALLKDAMAALTSAAVSTDAAPAVDSETVFFAALDARVNAALARASRVEAGLKKFQATYSDSLEKLAATSRDDLLRGMPSGTSLAIQGSTERVAMLMRTIEGTRDLLAGGLTNIQTGTRALTAFMTRARLRGPFPIPATTADARNVDLVQTLSDLGHTNDDTLVSLNDRIAGIANMLADLAATKKRVARDATAPDPIRFEPSYQTVIDAKRLVNLEEPSRCDLNYSPYDVK
ncbi:MAG: hypothetical protein ACRD2A_15585, partial [Vicinamibacterales bacterium]